MLAPTTLSSSDDIAVAEEFGYARAWLYDTPQNSPDVWMSLSLAAERTSRIGLGPGVLISSLRHPMVNAAGTATLARWRRGAWRSRSAPGLVDGCPHLRRRAGDSGGS